jgi:hypothetical protein
MRFQDSLGVEDLQRLAEQLLNTNVPVSLVRGRERRGSDIRVRANRTVRRDQRPRQRHHGRARLAGRPACRHNALHHCARR